MDPILAAFEFTRPLFESRRRSRPKEARERRRPPSHLRAGHRSWCECPACRPGFEDPAELAARFADLSRRTGTRRSRRSGSGSSPGSPRLSRKRAGSSPETGSMPSWAAFAPSPSRRKQGGIRHRPSASPPSLGDGRGSARTRPKRLRLAPPGGQFRPAVAARPRLTPPRSW
jgi:hypothetical protein